MRDQGMPVIRRWAMNLQDNFPIITKLWEWMYGEHRMNVTRKEPLWPKDIFCPTARAMRFYKKLNNRTRPQWRALLRAGARERDEDYPMKNNRSLIAVHLGDIISHMLALGAWTVTQGIYTFHEEVFEQVWQPYQGVITENFLRLPEWSVYLHLPDQISRPLVGTEERFTGYCGCLVWLDFFEGMRELNIRMVSEEESKQPSHFPELLSFTLDLVPGTSVEEAVERVNYPPSAELFLHILSLLSYLGDRTCDKAAPPIRPVAKKTLKGAKFPHVKEPRIYQVGSRLGPVLGKMRKLMETTSIIASKTGMSSIPVVVKAHPSHRWHGKRDGAQWLEDCWIFPYLKGFEPSQWREYPAIIREVMMVSPSLIRKYPAIAEELGIKYTELD